jgi:hypothetical protein
MKSYSNTISNDLIVMDLIAKIEHCVGADSAFNLNDTLNKYWFYGWIDDDLYYRCGVLLFEACSWLPSV